MPKKKTAPKAAPQPAKFLRFNAIKEYINDNLKVRSSDKAVKKFIKEFDAAIGATLKEAKKSAREDKRNTIMDQDIIPALEKHLGKKYLTWQETVKEIIRQNPTDLGKISKAVNDYIEKGQGK